MTEAPKLQPDDREEDQDLFEFDSRLKFRLGGGASWKRWLMGATTIGLTSAAAAGAVKRLMEIFPQ